MERHPKHRLFGEGYTFIELLIVMAVIAILAVIALYQVAAFRERAVRAKMQSDARNVATVMESYFADHQTYPSFDARFDDPFVMNNQIIRPSPDDYVLVQGGDTTYRIIVNNPGGGEGSQNCSLTSQGDSAWY